MLGQDEGGCKLGGRQPDGACGFPRPAAAMNRTEEPFGSCVREKSNAEIKREMGLGETKFRNLKHRAKIRLAERAYRVTNVQRST